MAIMAMDTARKHNLLLSLLAIYVFPTQIYAGEWKFDPEVTFNQTYTDNVELSKDSDISSYVNQTSAGLNIDFSSRMANFSLNGRGTYASYTHNHDLDDDYKTLDAKGQLLLWTSGPMFIFDANIANVNRNAAKNSLADLVSADTVESQRYLAGFQYNVENSHHSLNSSISYSTINNDDGVGESDGYAVSIASKNGNSARHVYWQAKGKLYDRENGIAQGKSYGVEINLGWITPYSVVPFIRYYDEDSTGNIISQQNTSMSSWGPGVTWQVSRHFALNASYNYVDDTSKSDNYVATAISWQPSARTSIEAGYSKRFFGDSYSLNITHKNRRMTNSVSYNETIEAFNRDNYQRNLQGSYWCPVGNDFAENPLTCILKNDDVVNFSDYQLVNSYELELIEGNEFSINKRFSWQSDLSLARTKFSANISNLERESLTTNRLDNTLTTSFNITRKISVKSDIKFSFQFSHNEFDKEKIGDFGQEDYYRTFTASYTRNLASSLSATFSVQRLDRNSSRDYLTYDEVRAIINLSKDF
ncbi:TIGR03016 family PEP-CTERM system-associated outer membrane protein [Colwelliaceae bacterium 6471]